MGKSTIKDPNERRAYWLSKLGEWKASGLKATAYCRREGIQIYRFKYWQYRLLDMAGNAGSKPNAPLIAFAEVKVKSLVQKQQPLRLEIHEGLSLVIPLNFDEVTLVRVLKCLGDMRC